MWTADQRSSRSSTGMSAGQRGQYKVNGRASSFRCLAQPGRGDSFTGRGRLVAAACWGWPKGRPAGQAGSRRDRRATRREVRGPAVDRPGPGNQTQASKKGGPEGPIMARACGLRPSPNEKWRIAHVCRHPARHPPTC